LKERFSKQNEAVPFITLKKGKGEDGPSRKGQKKEGSADTAGQVRKTGLGG